MATDTGREALHRPHGDLGAAERAPDLTARAPVLPPRLLIGGGLLVVAFVYLVLTSLQTSAVYYITVGELLARESAAGQTVRLAGEVVDGSIQRSRQQLRFELSDGTATVPVVHSGQVPDLFGYRAEGAYQDVVLEGRYTSSGVFEARNIIVRHGPSFESAEQ